MYGLLTPVVSPKVRKCELIDWLLFEAHASRVCADPR